MIHNSFTNYRQKEVAILTKSANLFNNDILLYCSPKSRNFLEGFGLKFQWRECPYSNCEEKIDVWSTDPNSPFFKQKYTNFEGTIRDFGHASYVGTDVIFVDHCKFDFPQYDIALTPHHISYEKEQIFGRYNVDFVWSNNPKIIEWLRQNMSRSRHSDQFTYDFIRERFVVKELDMGYNMGWYRLSLDHNEAQIVQKRISAIQNKEDGIYIGEEKIRFFQTHFNPQNYGYCNWFNTFLLHLLKDGGHRHRELAQFISDLC